MSIPDPFGADYDPFAPTEVKKTVAAADLFASPGKGASDLFSSDDAFTSTLSAYSRPTSAIKEPKTYDDLNEESFSVESHDVGVQKHSEANNRVQSWSDDESSGPVGDADADPLANEEVPQWLTVDVETRQFLCPICSDPMNEPVTLPCGHSGCRDCFRALRTKVSSTVKCPACSTPHDASIIDNLKPNKVLESIMASANQTGRPSKSKPNKAGRDCMNSDFVKGIKPAMQTTGATLQRWGQAASTTAREQVWPFMKKWGGIAKAKSVSLWKRARGETPDVIDANDGDLNDGDDAQASANQDGSSSHSYSDPFASDAYQDSALPRARRPAGADFQDDL